MQDEYPIREQSEQPAEAEEVYVRRTPQEDEMAGWFAPEAERNGSALGTAPEPSSNDHAQASTVLAFHGLHDEPFGITPDPAYLYSSRTHSDALQSLYFGIRENRGFLALVAEPGMGKTSLLFQLLEDLRDSARTVFLFQTQCDSEEFVRYILHGLDIDTQGMGLVAMHDKLNEVLFREMLAGKRFVLLVDEAQNLDDSVLETVRMLSNYEAHHTKLLQIILAGQPQLAAKLAEPQLLQLRQRISVLAHLEPLGVPDVAAYLGHRLAVAGYRGESSLFTPDAVAFVTQISKGIPRNINNLCYHALQVSYTWQSRTITPEIVQEAANRLDITPLVPRQTMVAGSQANALGSAPASGAVFHYQPATFMAQVRALFAPSRWAFRLAILAAILVAGGWFLVMQRGKRTEAGAADTSSPANPAGSLPNPNKAVFSGDPRSIGEGQLLTVVVRPNQSLKDIGLRYAGYFDANLVEEIRALNPGLDPDHLAAGQLLEIPLPPDTLKKGN